MKTIYFIRHGQTKYNTEGRFVGSTDLPLSAEGRKNIEEKWAGKSEHIDKDVIYTSPMKRCIETSNIIFPDDTFSVIKDMREMNFGIFEGKTHDELSSLSSYIHFRETNGKLLKKMSNIKMRKASLYLDFPQIQKMNRNKSSGNLIDSKTLFNTKYNNICK